MSVYQSTSCWLAVLFSVAYAGVVTAQTAENDQSEDASSEEVEEIVITGSRVVKNGNLSPTPVTVVNTEEILRLQPGTIGEALAQLPAFAGSRIGVANPSTGISNSGISNLNLRYLGYLRTLVLFDGMRVPPSSFEQYVDISMIPQMMLDRVDVVTGGVSAVYGSDAVAGVVNFVTDRNFNGFNFNVESGIAGQGDGQTFAAGVAAGTQVGSRGHVQFSYEYRNDEGIPHRSQRAWAREIWTVNGLGTEEAPYRLWENTRISTSTFGGLISDATGTGTVLNGQTFDANGVLSPFVDGIETGRPGLQSGGSGSYFDASLKQAVESHKSFGRFDYDLNDSVHAFVQATYAKNNVANFDQYYQLRGVELDGQNPFLPDQYQFDGTFELSKMLREYDRINMHTEQDQYFVIAGLEGDMGDGWEWNFAVTRGEADSISRNTSQVDAQKLAAALDVVLDSSGHAVCAVSITNPGLYPGCTPYNPFGPSSASQSAMDYINTPSQFEVNNGQTGVTGSVSGSPFSNWAGPVAVALSAEWREQTFEVTSNAQPDDLMDCTGLTTNCDEEDNRWLASVLGDIDEVSMTVGEVAVELDVPLTQWLSFNGAARYTDYDTIGEVSTWKAGLNWQMNDQLTLRATRSRDIRAPNLYDLYNPLGFEIITEFDFLTNQTVTVPFYSGGNPDLKEEVGDTLTAGVVYRPSWLENFSVSVDAWHIAISDALLEEDGSNSRPQTQCYDSGGSAPTCQLQDRPNGFTDTSPANAVTAFYETFVNIEELETWGLDLEANYATSLWGNPFSLRGFLTWQPHLINSSPGVPDQESAGVGFSGGGGGVGSFAVPQVRLMLFAKLSVDNFEFDMKQRWRSAISLWSTPGLIYLTDDVDPAAYTDLTIKYYGGDDGLLANTEFYLNVMNIFDKQPEPAGGSGQGPRVGSFGGYLLGDDPIGRYFTLGFNYRY